jgi:hypothetical protein
LTEIECTVSVFQAIDFLERQAPVVLADKEVDETGTGDLHLVQQKAIVHQLCDDGLGDHPGVLLCLGSDHHGHVGRVVTVGRVARCLQFNKREVLHFEQAFGHATRRRFFKQLDDFLFHGSIKSCCPS